MTAKRVLAIIARVQGVVRPAWPDEIRPSALVTTSWRPIRKIASARSGESPRPIQPSADRNYLAQLCDD